MDIYEGLVEKPIFLTMQTWFCLSMDGLEIYQ